MAKGPPKLVTVAPDDYHAEFVGRTRDGRQFFLTIPFVPGGHEFVALYLFDKSGQLRSATIDDFGPRESLDEPARNARFDALLASLGEVTYRRIRVAPFRLEMFGVEFGFIPRAPEEPGEDWAVIVEPGNVMCFGPPWTSGVYDT
jgi:hypothetical protein